MLRWTRRIGMSCGLLLTLGCAAGPGTRSAAPAVLQAETQSSSTLLASDAEHGGSTRGAPRSVSLAELATLTAALDNFPGCLGTERAVTTSGKLAIFAWFENKAALLKWYYSTVHQEIMAPGEDSRHHTPLTHVPDDAGPILVITTITVASGARLLSGELSLSQIAIELYEPLPGGHYFGQRFAPRAVQIPHSVDIGGQ